MNLTIKQISGVILVIILVGLYFVLRPDNNAKVIADLPRVIKDEEGITKIVAFGDSLTAGYNLPVASSYPAQLEAKLIENGYQVRVVNAGVSGETTRGSLERVEFILKQDPDIVILGIGGNDALRVLPVSEARQNLEQTILALKSANNPPILFLLQMQAPLTAGLSYKKEFDAMYEELAEQYDVILVPFLTPELWFDSKNKLSDGIHYNAEGYKRAVENYIYPLVKEVLDQID